MENQLDSWTPEKIRKLRGKRTQEAFGKVIRIPKNTIWRWESGLSRPDRTRARRLSTLAAKEGFLQDWELAGSAVLLGDLEEGSKHLSRHFKVSGRSIAAKWD